MTTFGVGGGLPPFNAGRGGSIDPAAGQRAGEAGAPTGTASAGDQVDFAASVPAGASGYYDAAQTIHRADQAMGQIGTTLGDFRDQLGYVKMYPPYPPDEPKRAALIRSLLGFHSAIDGLAGKNLTPVAISRGAGSPQVQVNLPTVDASAAGLNLPALPATIDARAAEQAIAQVDAARTTLAARRATFAAATRTALDTVSGVAGDTLDAKALGRQLAAVSDGLARPSSRGFLNDLG